MQQDIFQRPKVSLRGMLLLFSVVLLVGIIIGGLASLIRNFIYLIIIFPMLMGAVAGYFIKAIVVTEKIRSPFVVVLAGIFSAVLIFGSMHFVDYLQFRSRVAKQIQAQVIAEYGEPAMDEKVQAYIDSVLVKQTGMSGFIGFFLLEAKQGVSISSLESGNNGSGMNLGVFTWLYWLVEMGFIGGVSISSAYKIAKSLFCEHCDAWVAEGQHIGGVKPELLNQTVEFIKSRDFHSLTGMLRDNTQLPSIEFYTRTCKTCNTFPFYLTGFVISPGRQGRTQSKVFMVQVLNSSERFALTSALATRPMEK